MFIKAKNKVLIAFDSTTSCFSVENVMSSPFAVFV